MTLAAKLNNQTYSSLEIIEDFGKNNIFTCIGCGEQLIFHRNIAKVKIQHWVHKSTCKFETEPETAEHMRLKHYFYTVLKADKKYYPDSVFIGNQKPDLLIEQEGKQIAIEVQCSKISYEDFIQRSQDYAKKGIHVFWILGNKYFKGDKLRKRVSVVEKALHQLHFGWIYYSEEADQNFIGRYHFENCFGTKEWNDDCFDYKLKSTKQVNKLTKIRNFKLRLFTNSRNDVDYLLAEFCYEQDKEMG